MSGTIAWSTDCRVKISEKGLAGRERKARRAEKESKEAARAAAEGDVVWHIRAGQILP